jgi:hypothetical protein
MNIVLSSKKIWLMGPENGFMDAKTVLGASTNLTVPVESPIAKMFEQKLLT